jgi:hypothetical protein
MFFVQMGEASLLVFTISCWLTDKDSTILIVILVIIIIKLILSKRTKDYCILRLILNICQNVLLISLIIDYFFQLDFMIFIMIMLTISLIEMIDLFFKSLKAYKYGSIIIYCLSFSCLVAFWFLNTTLSRFEYKLNQDGQSYSIVDIKSDIHTIRVPSTYKGLPITIIKDRGIHSKGKIKVVIFEEDINIKGISLSVSLTNLRRIQLPSSLNNIESDDFDFKYLEEVIIPIEVVYIEKHAFDCENAIIYCEAESKPENWDEKWCYKAKEIIWGYKG